MLWASIEANAAAFVAAALVAVAEHWLGGALVEPAVFVGEATREVEPCTRSPGGAQAPEKKNIQ